MSKALENIKARWSAKRFDIYKEQIDHKAKYLDGYFISRDGTIWYGCKFYIFFKSSQNDWWQERLNEHPNKEQFINQLFDTAPKG
jgi:NurA-like 5'-3' nuclease